VILSHVTSGVEIARREGMPDAVLAFIPQHHGTRLVTFFYRRAAEDDPSVDPELFRYPGPRPQTREAALVMLADASEASVRASDDHSPEHIRDIVEDVIRERVEEGQFDECDVSLRDLRVVADSYVNTLVAVYHPRVEYPAPTLRELAGRRRWLSPVDESEDLPGARWARLPRPIPPVPPTQRSHDELDEDSRPEARTL
jgi:membrane-associated HD superfamily phosphohydrolase